jgi:hypothetical protein
MDSFEGLVTLNNGCNTDFARFRMLVDGVERYVPSDEMLEEVLQTLPTPSAKEILCGNSNILVQGIPMVYAHPLVIEELTIWELCCRELGISFQEYCWASVAMFWYGILDSPMISPRVSYDAWRYFSEALEPAFGGELRWGFDTISSAIEGIDCPEMRWEGFRSAWAVHEKILYKTVEGAKTNHRLYFLFNWLLLSRKKSSRKRLKDNRIDKAIAQCRFCGSQFGFYLKRGVSKRPPHCGATECKKAYQRTAKAKKRPPKLPPGWSGVGNRQNCTGCGEKRKLNADKICQKCFSVDKNV